MSTYNDYRPDAVAPYEIVEQPASEPVTTAEIRKFVRQDTTADDDILGLLVTSARQWVEEYTGRALITQRWQAFAPAFPDADAPLIIPGGKVADSPAPVMEYQNDEGTWVVLASSAWFVEPGNRNDYAAVYPSVAAGRGWPSTVTEGDGRRRGGTGWKARNVIRFAYTVGYGAASQVPEAIKTAIKLHASFHYDNRNMPMPEKHVAALHEWLAPYRLRAFGA